MAGGRIRAFDESVLSAAFDMLLVNYLLAYPADRLIKCGAVVRPLQCEKFVLEPSLNRNPDFNHKSLANQYVIRRLYYFHLFAALFPFPFPFPFASLLLFLSFMFQPLITSSAL